MEKKDKNKKVKEVIDAFHQNEEEIPSDVFGSYTGIDIEDESGPVQDADDI